nr:hypothetical protein [Micromonospora sp. DSM 115978]
VDTLDNGVGRPERIGDPWDATVVPDDESDPTATERIAQTLTASSDVAAWYSEADRRASFAGETYLARAVGGGAPGYELGAGRLPAAGAGEVAVGYGLVHNASIDLGSVVTVEITGQPVTATVTGWYRTTEDTGEIFLLPMADLVALEPDATPARFRVTSAGPSADELAAALAAQLGDTSDVRARDADVTGIDAMRTGVYV